MYGLAGGQGCGEHQQAACNTQRVGQGIIIICVWVCVVTIPQAGQVPTSSLALPSPLFFMHPVCHHTLPFDHTFIFVLLSACTAATHHRLSGTCAPSTRKTRGPSSPPSTTPSRKVGCPSLFVHVFVDVCAFACSRRRIRPAMRPLLTHVCGFHAVPSFLVVCSSSSRPHYNPIIRSAAFSDTDGVELVDVSSGLSDLLASKTEDELSLMQTAAMASALAMNKDMKRTILDNLGEASVRGLHTTCVHSYTCTRTRCLLSPPPLMWGSMPVCLHNHNHNNPCLRPALPPPPSLPPRIPIAGDT